MKKSILIIVIIVLNFGILLGQEDSTKIILSKYFNLVGDWDDVKTLKIETDVIGGISQNHESNTQYLSFYPFAYRLERISDKNSTTIGIKGKNEWTMINGNLISYENNFSNSASFPVEFNYPNPLSIKAMLKLGMKFQFLGQELYNDMLCFKVSAEIAEGFEQLYYFSVIDFSLVMELRKNSSKNFYTKTEYYNYQKVNKDKYCVPFKRIGFSKFSDKPTIYELKSIEFNPKFEDDLFSAPKRK